MNDETLALDVIDELGPTGSFLGHDHTIRHYKEPFYSKLADKGPYSSWADKGATTMEQRAAVMVDRILAKHKTQPLAGRSSGGHPGDRRPRAEVDRRAEVGAKFTTETRRARRRHAAAKVFRFSLEWRLSRSCL